MMQVAPIPSGEPFPELLKTPVIDVEPKLAQSQPLLVSESAEEAAAAPPSPFQELSPVDRLHINKRLCMKSVLCLRGKKNKFTVKNSDQTLAYTIDEENRWWVGYLCYGLRPLELKVSNSQGEEVMRIVRPYSFTMRILPCQLQSLQVFAPPGELIGTVEQQWTPVKPLYLVKNKDGDVAFRILGPRMTISCFNDVKFCITRADGTHVGGTCKRWQGLIHALFFAPVRDKFGVAFDVDLSADEKALLLATSLLMEYMYFDA